MKSNIISTQFINSTHFYKNLQQQLNSYYKSEIVSTQSINSSTKHLITTTTTIKLEFINNKPQSTSFFIKFEQDTSIPIYTSQACNSNNNNSIIIKFTYLNFTSKTQARISTIEFTINHFSTNKHL